MLASGFFVLNIGMHKLNAKTYIFMMP